MPGLPSFVSEVVFGNEQARAMKEVLWLGLQEGRRLGPWFEVTGCAVKELDVEVSLKSGRGVELRRLTAVHWC